MPKYRIITQNDLDDTHPHRHSRAEAPEAQTATIVEALNPADAIAKFETMSDTPIAGWIRGEMITARIVSIEELSVFDPESITDQMIDDALIAEGPDGTPMDVQQYEDFDEIPLYSDTAHFLEVVSDVVERLNYSELAPGLHISLLQGGDNCVDYSMVEVYEPVTHRYLATGCEIKRLTTDRSSRGFNAVRCIARALLEEAAPLM